MKTITVADAAPMSTHIPLYTSHRGGLVLSIRDDGDDWYSIRVQVPKKEQHRYHVEGSITRQVRGDKKLYYKD